MVCPRSLLCSALARSARTSVARSGITAITKTADVAVFVRDLLRHLRGPVIVVWDNGAMHRGEPIRQPRADFSLLSIEYLPPYAPPSTQSNNSGIT
jgi:hypothetical protein